MTVKRAKEKRMRKFEDAEILKELERFYEQLDYINMQLDEAIKKAANKNDESEEILKIAQRLADVELGIALLEASLKLNKKYKDIKNKVIDLSKKR